MATSALSARSAAVTRSSERPSPGSITGAPSFVAAPGGGAVSAAGERCLPWPILDQTAHSCPLVLGGQQPREVQPLDLDPRIEVDIEATSDGLLRCGQRHAR